MAFWKGVDSRSILEEQFGPACTLSQSTKKLSPFPGLEHALLELFSSDYWIIILPPAKLSFWYSTNIA